jgi:hypothetical protein
MNAEKNKEACVFVACMIAGMVGLLCFPEGCQPAAAIIGCLVGGVLGMIVAEKSPQAAKASGVLLGTAGVLGLVFLLLWWVGAIKF